MNGVGSATGLAAPGAGTTGSAPTFDVLSRKARRAGERVEVTKNAAFLAGAHEAMEKVAYNTAADRDGPQTTGESKVNESASQVAGHTDHGGRSKSNVTRGPGNQGSKGVPEWLRGLKFLRAPGTWKGGDKSGPQADDNQFETPGSGGRS